MGELARKLKEESADVAASPVTPARLAGLIALVERGVVSGPTAKDVFEKMFRSRQSAEEIVRAEGLTQVDDEAQIVELVHRVIASQPDAVAQYRGGKTATFGFLVGQVMKAAGGKANPKRVNELLRRELEPQKTGGAAG